MKRKVVYLCLSIIIALFSIVVLGKTVNAADAPDSLLILSAQVARNTIETGDMAIVFHYNIYYSGTVPTDLASDTIIFRLHNPAGTVLIASAVPYVMFDNGYNTGVGSFYFDSATAPTWGEAYRINIFGSPAFFDPLLDSYSFTLSASHYTSSAIGAVNRLLMADYIISLARLMNEAYSPVVFFGSTDMQIVLSDSGEQYFRGAIPGLQSIAPSLFLTQQFVPEPEYPETDLAQTLTYAERLADSDVMRGFAAIGAEMAMPGEAVAGGLVFIIAIGFIILTIKLKWGRDPGMIAASGFLAAAAVLLGGSVMVVGVVLALISGIIIMMMLFLRKA